MTINIHNTVPGAMVIHPHGPAADTADLKESLKTIMDKIEELNKATAANTQAVQDEVTRETAAEADAKDAHTQLDAANAQIDADKTEIADDEAKIAQLQSDSDAKDAAIDSATTAIEANTASLNASVPASVPVSAPTAPASDGTVTVNLPPGTPTPALESTVTIQADPNNPDALSGNATVKAINDNGSLQVLPDSPSA